MHPPATPIVIPAAGIAPSGRRAAQAPLFAGKDTYAAASAEARLMCAVAARDLEAARRVFESAKPDLNAADAENFLIPWPTVTAGRLTGHHPAAGVTPLFVALYQQDWPMVEWLLEAGADARHVDGEGHTALMALAVSVNRNGFVAGDSDFDVKKAVRRLLDAGVKIDDQDEQGMTALMHAIERGRMDVADALMEAGARLDLKDNNGWDVAAWEKAARRGKRHEHFPTVMDRYLAASHNGVFIAGEVFRAGAKGDVEALRRYHADGVNLDMQEPLAGRTLLIDASGRGDMDVMTFLLEDVGVSVDKPDNGLRTPVMHAAVEGQLPAIGFLDGRKADLKRRDIHRETALTLSVGHRQFEAAFDLLDRYEHKNLKVDEEEAAKLVGHLAEIRKSGKGVDEGVLEALEKRLKALSAGGGKH